MNLKTVIYDKPNQDAMDIRIKVFVKEQGFRDEFDKIDDIAKHVVIYDNDKAIATARFYLVDDYYLLGRIAILKEYRGLHLGEYLIKETEKELKNMGATLLKIHAQERAVGFYLKQGYIDSGIHDMDENYPHRWLYKNI